MKKANLVYGSFVFLVLFYTCAPTRFVKPLNKNETAVSLSFGGPLIRYSNAATPIPFTTLAVGRGITNNVTLFGSLHTTSALFGNFQTDIGSTIRLYEKENVFGFSVSPSIQVAYNIRNSTGFRLWPALDLNGYYHLNKQASYLYGGITTWFETTKTRSHGEIQPRHVIYCSHVGYSFINPKWRHQIDLSYLGMGIANTPGVVEYIGLSHKGSIGIYYAIIKVF